MSGVVNVHGSFELLMINVKGNSSFTKAFFKSPKYSFSHLDVISWKFWTFMKLTQAIEKRGIAPLNTRQHFDKIVLLVDNRNSLPLCSDNPGRPKITQIHVAIFSEILRLFCIVPAQLLK